MIIQRGVAQQGETDYAEPSSSQLQEPESPDRTTARSQGGADGDQLQQAGYFVGSTDGL